MNAHFTDCHVAITSPTIGMHTVISLVFRSAEIVNIIREV